MVKLSDWPLKYWFLDRIYDLTEISLIQYQICFLWVIGFLFACYAVYDYESYFLIDGYAIYYWWFWVGVVGSCFLLSLFLTWSNSGTNLGKFHIGKFHNANFWNKLGSGE